MDELGNAFNINKCRTCFNPCDDLQTLTKLSIVDMSGKISYGELLKEVANINIADDIGHVMPQYICNCCTHKLKSSHEFIKQAQEVNDKLWSLLNNTQKMDCLQESEIEFQTCLKIKKESRDKNVDGESPGELEIKTEFADEDEFINEIGTNTLNECDDMEIPVFNPEIDAFSSKKKPDISEDETDKEGSTDDSCHKPARRKNTHEKDSSKEKHISIENNDEDADIAVRCLQCNKIFNNSKELTRHLRNAHLSEDQKCSCLVCGIKFTRPCNMYKHMRKLHDPESVKDLLPAKEKPFGCDKCHRRYTRKRQLNCHIKEKHTNEDDTSAKDSPKHSKKTPQVRSLCFVCGSSFSNKAHLIVHMTRHTGEKPFKCDLCDRAFPRMADLTSHRRIHTGEKPFKCKICEKAFRVSTKLATHMRSHTNERPYKCKQCERSFKYSKDLNIHMRIHTGERPYSCTVCGSTFTQSNSLKTHRMKLGHMEDSAPL